MEGTIDNVLYFVGVDLEDAVSYAEFVSNDAAMAFGYIQNHKLGATHNVFRVTTTANLGTSRVMRNPIDVVPGESPEELSLQRDSGSSKPRKTGRGAGRSGMGGGFCGGIGAGL